MQGKLCCFEGSGANCGNWDAGGAGAGAIGNPDWGPAAHCPNQPSLGIGQPGADATGARPILGAVPDPNNGPPKFTSGGW